MVGLLIVSTLMIGPAPSDDGAVVVQRPSTLAPVAAPASDAPAPETAPETAPQPAPDHASQPQPAPVSAAEPGIELSGPVVPLGEPMPEEPPARLPGPSADFEPDLSTSVVDPTVSFAAVGQDDWRADYVRVSPPEYRGTGMMVTGIVAFGTLGLMQTVWTGLCGDPYCDMPGIHQRALVAGGLIFTSGGAWKRGQWDAYRDTLAGTPLSARRVRNHLIAGWTLAAAGLVGLGVDFALHTECAVSGRGPYLEEEPEPGGFWGPDCKGVASGLVMDLSAASAAIGLGFGLHAAKYKRDRKYYEGARIAIMPNVGRDRFGFGIAGRF